MVALKAVSRTQGANAQIKTGELSPTGFELQFEEWPVLVKAFRAMVREQAFDVAEMALTTYICARQHGVPIIGIPVFLLRGFHHDKISVLADGPIQSPGDLNGTAIGVNRGYTVTTGVWARTLLDRLGVNLESVSWQRSGDEHVEAYQPPANVSNIPDGETLEAMLLDGRLSAVAGMAPDEFASGQMRSFISNPEAAAIEAVETEGFYPINHLIVLKESVVAAYPELPNALFDCFVAQKRHYLDALATQSGDDLDETDQRNLTLLQRGIDPLPYGVEPNLQVLNALIQSGLRQHILKPTSGWHDYFVASTLNQIG